MKLLKFLFLAVFIFTGTLMQSLAQESSTEKTTVKTQVAEENKNYALLIRNFNHLKAAVKTIDMLKEDRPNAVNKFEVVICGKKIVHINEHKSLINKSQEKGITLTACGMTMNKFSMDKKDLPKGVGVVPNGLIRIFKLQEDGYKTITL